MTARSLSAISICPKAAAKRRFWWRSMAAAGRSGPGFYQHWGPFLARNGYAAVLPSNTGSANGRLSRRGLRRQSSGSIRAGQSRRVRPRSRSHRPDWRFCRRASVGARRARGRSVDFRPIATMPMPRCRPTSKRWSAFTASMILLAQWTPRSCCAAARSDRGKISRHLADGEPPDLFRRFADQPRHRRSQSAAIPADPRHRRRHCRFGRPVGRVSHRA